MTLYSDLLPASWILLKRRCVWRNNGALTIAAPTNTTHLRVTGVAVGGQGDNQGGASAFVKSVVPCAAGDSITAQNGLMGSFSTPGDAYVTKNGSYVLYVDRGRGAGPGGKAANSIGDVRLDGSNNSSGYAPADPSTFKLLPLPTTAMAPGKGGYNVPILLDDNVTVICYVADNPAGQGKLFLEFYQGDPAH